MVDLQQIAGYGNLHAFTYKELKHVTNDFWSGDILGVGGFGLVYKGTIDDNVRPGFEQTLVAVKKLNPEGFQGDKEWLVTITHIKFHKIQIDIYSHIMYSLSNFLLVLHLNMVAKLIR